MALICNLCNNLWKKKTKSSIQKQPSRGTLRKRCSENMQQIYRRITMPKCEWLLLADTLISDITLRMAHLQSWTKDCRQIHEIK